MPDANALLLSMLIGSVGLGFFVYGKRQGRFPQLLGGTALMVYPYFVPSLILMAAVAVGIVTATWIAVKLGA